MKTKQIFITFLIFLFLLGYYYIFEVKKKKEDIIKKEKEEKIFPDLKKENITEIFIKNENGKFLFKKVGADWELFEPIHDLADNSAIDSIANAYINRKMVQKIEKANLQDFGLTNTASVIETEIKTSDGKFLKLNIGDKNPTGNYVYIIKPEMPEIVYITDSDIRTWCEKKLFDYRYRYIVKFDENKITKIEVNIKDKGKNYIIEKKDDGWHIIKPFKDIAKKEKVTSLISSFKTTMGKSMEKPTDENLKKYGLASPFEYIKFYEGDKEHIIYIGKYFKDKYSYYIKTNRIKEIMEMPDYVYTNLTKAEDIRNKQIIIFESQQVKKIEIKSGDKLIVAEKIKDKKGVENWEYKHTKNINKEEKKKLSMWTVSSEIFNADFKERIKVDEKINEKEKYGLEKDDRYIRLFDGNNNIIGTVFIGKKIEGKEEIYVKVPERKEIYIIEARHISNVSLPGIEIK